MANAHERKRCVQFPWPGWILQKVCSRIQPESQAINRTDKGQDTLEMGVRTGRGVQQVKGKSNQCTGFAYARL